MAGMKNQRGKGVRTARRMLGLPMYGRVRRLGPLELAAMLAYFAWLAWMWWAS
jgi:hypothetical protein